jgi:hypothetical protein
MPLMNFARFPKWTLSPDIYRDMKPVTVKVLGCLADCLNAKDDAGKVSVRTVCERCNLSRRTVQISLSELAAIGLLKRDCKTGEYEFLPRTGGAPQCAGAHGDARGGAPQCAGGRTTVREGAHGDAQSEGRNKDSPRTSYQELYLQEGEREPVMVMHKGKRVSPYHSAAPLLTATGWPENRWCGETGVRAITKALVRISDGCEGESAASDPVQWLGARMNAAAKSTDDPRFVPKITKWLEENYPHLISEGEPAQ